MDCKKTVGCDYPLELEGQCSPVRACNPPVDSNGNCGIYIQASAVRPEQGGWIAILHRKPA